MEVDDDARNADGRLNLRSAKRLRVARRGL